MNHDVDRGWPGLLDLYAKAVDQRGGKMNGFVIHSVPGSPHGRGVMVALEEKRSPYRLSAVTPGSLQSPRHLAMHPVGKIPVMDHGSFRLYEVQAIIRYVDRVLPGLKLTPAMRI